MNPITGNIMKMENIVKPRKAIADYYEGERVSALLKGFGVPDGVIGKITEESQRKELEDILRGKRFEALVQRIVHSAAYDVPITEIKLHRPKARKPPMGKPSEELFTFRGGSENDAGSITCTSPTPTDKACDDSRVVAGFTLSQLECKVAHLSSAPKVAALLFRTLLKEEKYLGKTLTGAGGKPKVDQERMSIIYSIINKRFPVYQMASLKHSLCDLLKPSRQKKKLC